MMVESKNILVKVIGENHKGTLKKLIAEKVDAESFFNWDFKLEIRMGKLTLVREQKR
jgi:hypothetical protein